ncbi:hypothetical protein PR048_011829 [Dryococelus australis]|uniref:Uncharacterized protein n=1 Tax=Dryococelus australis TaxID=614101 RepID=A0ABQ9HML9_9NEOP|nr:hypothetical protein PR048_011829 [Dryococelus australis]
MGKKFRGLRGNCNRSMMEKVLELLRRNDSQRNYLKSGSSEGKLGCHKILTADQEKDIVERIIRFADIGLTLKPVLKRRSVFKFVEKHNIKHPFNKVEKLAAENGFQYHPQSHPLDKSVFRSFEHHWDAELLHWWDREPEDPDSKLTKDTFSGVGIHSGLEQIHDSEQHNKIINDFCATGIHPFDPKVIPEVAFAPNPKCRNEKAKSPFQEIFPAPHKKAKQTPGVPCKKAVNYKAQKLTRKLFAEFHDNDACTNQLEDVIAPV